MSRKFNALMLAAGFGTRLKAIGQKTAKGLFKNSQNQTITGMILTQLAKTEIKTQFKQIALITNNKFFKQYQAYCKKYHSDLKITVLNDQVKTAAARLGSLGDLILALDRLRWWEQKLLVLPSDRTPEDIILQLLLAFSKRPEAVTTCFFQDSKHNIKNKSGCAVLDQNQKIVDFEEKPTQPKSNYRALPFYLFPASALPLVKTYQQAKQNMDSPGNIIPWLLQNNYPVQACLTKKQSFDLGDLTDLVKFKQS